MLHVHLSFKSIVAPVLSAIVKVVVAISIWYVGQTLLEILTTQPFNKIEIQELRTLFGSVLFILVALELNYLLVHYARENKIEIHAILAVLIITYARKLVVFDLEDPLYHDDLALISSGFVILSAAVSHWIFHRSREAPRHRAEPEKRAASAARPAHLARQRLVVSAKAGGRRA